MSTMTKVEQAELDSALFKKLQELTMKMPKDPKLYKDDVQKYSKMYQQEFRKLLSDIQRKNERFAELLIFLSRCVKHFTSSLAYVPKQVIELLKNHGPNLHPYVRKKCVGSIMILRAKNILYPVQTIQFLLTLFNIEDKQLRKLLYKYLLNDIRRMNKHHKNVKINRDIRNYISQNIQKNSDKMTQKSLQMMIDLYKRNIWTDNRSVNIIAQGCFNQSSKIRMIASHFLVSTTQPLEELSESDSDAVNPQQMKYKKGITKQTKNKEKQMQKQKKRAARKLRKKQIQGRRLNFMPIDVIYSPQQFADKLFNFMSKKNIKFAHKIVYMSLISRIIWRHSLIILPWYGSLIKYLEPKQKQVHKVLTYFAESVHENLPDDQVDTIVKHIIEKFINDRCSQFSMTIGLNTIRQVYAKIPSIINEDTMSYLSNYYEYKNKNVRASAKSLINLVRDLNPYLLEKKYRGRNSNEGEQNQADKNPFKSIMDGAELLQCRREQQIPVYMDRILTDQDFKQIRKLKRKKDQEENIRQMEQEQEQELNFEEAQQIDQQEESMEDQSQSQSGDECQDQEEIDWEDCEEIQGSEGQEQQEGEEQQQVQQEGQQIQLEDGDQQEQDQLEQQDEDGQEQQGQIQVQVDDQLEEEIQSQMIEQSEQKKKNTKKVEERGKNKNKKELYESSDDEVVESSQSNNGFLNVEKIAFYKKTKGQIKADRKRNPQKKQKFKHKPKDKKGGGTTNREKQKLKPLMMLRGKKNKIRSQEKQVKLKIKNLKNQLGKVRSGKEAKRLKNKKITKLPKRR